MKKLTTEEFIEKAKRMFPQYNYSLTKYINSRTKLKIICPIHGAFEQLAKNHLSGHGCPKCANMHRNDNSKLTIKKFIEKANKIHSNFYDYSLVSYTNAHIKIKIVCPKHGVFEQSPYEHLNGKGCPKCKSSHGETKIRNYLLENNIIFEEQKRFKDCKNKLPLPFDFFLPEKNLLIEYNGKQHYESVTFFGGEEQLTKQQENDKLKKEFAEKNKIRLLTISYKENNKIEKIIDNFLFIN